MWLVRRNCSVWVDTIELSEAPLTNKVVLLLHRGNIPPCILSCDLLWLILTPDVLEMRQEICLRSAVRHKQSLLVWSREKHCLKGRKKEGDRNWFRFVSSELQLCLIKSRCEHTHTHTHSGCFVEQEVRQFVSNSSCKMFWLKTFHLNTQVCVCVCVCVCMCVCECVCGKSEAFN